MRSRSKVITASAMLTAIGLILGYIETFIVIPVNVPGVRIGLANTVSLIALYLLGPIYAFIVIVLRVTLSAMLFSGFSGFMYSMTGALLSFLIMSILKRFGFSVYSVSSGGAVAHNIGQLTVARILTGSVYVFWYMPVLIVAGLVAGSFVGLLCNILIRRLHNIFDNERNNQ